MEFVNFNSTYGPGYVKLNILTCSTNVRTAVFLNKRCLFSRDKKLNSTKNLSHPIQKQSTLNY